MILIVCALYAEAAGIIEHYELKKKRDPSLKFDAFEKEDGSLSLILTGVGLVNAAAAVSAAAVFYGLKQGDRILNIGTGAGCGKRGTVVLVNRIVNQMTGKTFYPDMLLKTELPEKTAVTVAKPVTQAEMDGCEDTVFDMEAAGVFEAAAFYVGQEDISILKVLSDQGLNGQEPVEDLKTVVKESMAEALPGLTAYLELLKKADREEKAGETARKEASLEEFVRKLSGDLCCSVTMENRLRQLIRYAGLEGTGHERIIRELYEEGLLPAGSKNEGKQVMKELENRLLES